MSFDTVTAAATRWLTYNMSMTSQQYKHQFQKEALPSERYRWTPNVKNRQFPGVTGKISLKKYVHRGRAFLSNGRSPHQPPAHGEYRARRCCVTCRLKFSRISSNGMITEYDLQFYNLSKIIKLIQKSYHC